MGIYDRDYYRRDGRGFLGSLAERGTICKWLIGINVVCFLIQFMTTTHLLGLIPVSKFTDVFILDYDKVMHGQVWRLLTYAFLHEVPPPGQFPWHIVVNMFFLYMFGRDVEDVCGRREFLAFYLVSAVVGGIVFFLTDLFATFPAPCLGASGAVMAVLVLAACHNPSRVILIFFVIPCPIWLLAILMVVMDAFDLLGNSGHVAVQVHLAGAAFAFLYHRCHWHLTGWMSNVKLRRTSRPRLRVYRDPEERYSVVNAPAPSQSTLDDEQLEAKMDAILEKISRVGKENLTDTEHALLLRASERLRRRRS